MSTKYTNWYVPLQPPSIGNQPPLPNEEEEQDLCAINGENPEGCNYQGPVIICQSYKVKHKCKNYVLQKHSTYPYLEAYVLTNDKKWGDPKIVNLENVTVYFYMYDSNDILRVRSICNIKEDQGIEYIWSKFDTQESGVYEGFFKLIFTLPNLDTIEIKLDQPYNKIQIIVQ